MFGLIRKAAVQNAGRERVDFPFVHTVENTAQIFESGLPFVEKRCAKVFAVQGG